MSKRRIAALALAGTALLGVQAALPAGASAALAAETGAVAPAAPVLSLPSARYVGPQTLTITAEPGTEIRYTLDGSHPTRQSPVYTEPLTVAETANVSAVAFTDRAESAPAISGVLVKTSEEPLAQFAVMSDIHLSTGDDTQKLKWEGYFDTLKRIAPQPDAIISNGDQINDNNFNTAHHHQYPREMLQHNLARTGMTDTQILMSFGNHDDRVGKMAEQYPDEWFPGTTGYYESAIGEFPAFVVNTEAWNSTQATWLYGRLTELSQNPATQGQPIFVFGHRPIPTTVWDGAQASNQGLKTNLSDFPQVVYFSGHSHLNITDERSIHQESFTSVNEGSMSYGENDNKYQAFGPGLALNPTIPTAQSVVVDVYADRVEIDRINYAAQPGRTYDDAGNWTFQNDPPFASSGSLAGPSWTIARGATPADVKSQFTYTQANRNTTAPAWGEAQPSVRQTETGPVLRLPQAPDDQFTAEYTLAVTDVQTGATANLVPANGRIYSDYVVAPKPAVLDIPLAVRAGNKVGQPIDRTLTIGREYEATLVAYDSYKNPSQPRTFRFVAGEIDSTRVAELTSAATPVIAQAERVLGASEPAEPADFNVAIGDVDAAETQIAALRESIAIQPTTQDAADAQGFAIADGTAALQELLAPVDRSGLAAAIATAEAALAEGEPATRRNAAPAAGVAEVSAAEPAPASGAEFVAGSVGELAAASAAEPVAASAGSTAAEPAAVLSAARAALEQELTSATTVQRTLNVPQAGIDAAAAALHAAEAAWRDALPVTPEPEKPEPEKPGPGKPGPETPGAEGSSGPGTGGQGTAAPASENAAELARTGGSATQLAALGLAGGLLAAAAAAMWGVRRAGRRA